MVPVTNMRYDMTDTGLDIIWIQEKRQKIVVNKILTMKNSTKNLTISCELRLLV